MKFLNKINRSYFFILIFSFLTLSILMYFIILQIINEQTEERLYEQALLIEKEIKETGNIPNIYPIIEIKQVNFNTKTKNTEIKTVFITNQEENEDEPYLQLTKFITINGKNYKLDIRKSIVEKEDLISSIILSVLISLFLIFVLIYYVNKKITKSLWQKFNDNLFEMEKYSFKQLGVIPLTDTNIQEFDKLNEIVRNMTRKLSTDYQNLKEFTENISHELQTPLAVLSMNLEEILQKELSDNILQKVYSSYKSVKKLADLNQSLILLAKIDNQQFEIKHKINLKNLINNKITELKPLFENKKIRLEHKIVSNFEINSNPYLMDILINNILSNAVKHNIKNGFIQITTQQNKLEISNSGKENNLLDNRTIFNRFVKGNSENYGLGLAIVKKICDYSNLEIKYVNKKNIHSFIISRKTLNFL